jgi:hypothetical protein
LDVERPCCSTADFEKVHRCRFLREPVICSQRNSCFQANGGPPEGMILSKSRAPTCNRPYYPARQQSATSRRASTRCQSRPGTGAGALEIAGQQIGDDSTNRASP